MDDLPKPTPRPARRKKSGSAKSSQDAQSSTLRREIETVRDLLQRVAGLAAEERTAGELLDILEAFSKASGRLAGLLKAEQSLAENTGELDIIQQALDAAWRKMRPNPPGSSPQ